MIRVSVNINISKCQCSGVCATLATDAQLRNNSSIKTSIGLPRLITPSIQLRYIPREKKKEHPKVTSILLSIINKRKVTSKTYY
jgi:hypothetical protein